jgi:hypothetical protein
MLHYNWFGHKEEDYQSILSFGNNETGTGVLCSPIKINCFWGKLCYDDQGAPLSSIKRSMISQVARQENILKYLSKTDLMSRIVWHTGIEDDEFNVFLIKEILLGLKCTYVQVVVITHISYVNVHIPKYNHSAGQQVPHPLWNQKFHILFTRLCHWNLSRIPVNSACFGHMPFYWSVELFPAFPFDVSIDTVDVRT